MAVVQYIAQMAASNPIAEPMDQQTQVMTDSRAGAQEVVYGNAGQTPAGGTTTSNMGHLLNSASVFHGLILVGFLVVLIWVGSGLMKKEKKE